MTWKFLKKIRGGHSFWRAADGRIALADESGDGRGRIGTPDMTDDGPLFIETAQPIVISHGRYMIPIVGGKHAIGGDTEIEWLETNLGMAVTPAWRTPES